MEVQKEKLDRQVRILFYFISLFTIKTLFSLLTRTRFALFISFFYYVIRFTITTRIRFSIATRNRFTITTRIMFTFSTSIYLL